MGNTQFYFNNESLTKSLFASVTTVGNVGITQTDLYTGSIPANSLNKNLDSAEAIVSGSFAANATTKQLTVKYAGVLIFDSGALAFNGGDWVIEIELIRVSATSVKTNVRLNTSNGTLSASAKRTTSAVDFTVSTNLVISALAGTGGLNNDIVGESFKGKWVAAP